MRYKDAIKLSMNEFAKDDKALFLGYNTKMGNQALGTLSEVPKEKIIETPLAENLIAGLSIGLSISGYKPVLYFERFDFILNAIDAIVNQLDKIKDLSKYQYRPKVVIRVVIGGKLKPFFTGTCHTQDFTEAMRKLVTFPVLKPLTSNEIIDAYKFAFQCEESVMIVETKDYYDIDY
jgi:pyruvate/2-oxoglutarate/acetoin dehydrogenase E1 component